MNELVNLRSDLASFVDPEKAMFLPRFFKTGIGEYGEGDKFLGVIVPNCRKVAKEYWNDLSLNDVETLLQSEWHEERQVALFILVLQFSKANELKQKQVFDLFLANTSRINNWDLVDCNAPRIVGKYIYDNQQYLPILDKLSKSDLLWDRRIAIISTLYFIIQCDPTPTLRIVKKLLSDNHDLIQKANGWMLREIGKRIDETILIDFLKKYYDQIPRTTLRYAIEQFKPSVRSRYLRGEF